MALMELRMALSALLLKYTWTGVADEPGKWNEEMSPRDSVVIHPRNGKCILDMKARA
jgi:hypothetical protein